MNFKFAIFLLFIGASSASFIASTNGNVALKQRFETISSPILKAVQRKAAEKDVIDDLLAVLAQILAEFEIFGDVITATLLEDLQNLLADLDVIGGDLLAQVVAILESYIDQLPQVVIDILVELGLLQPTKTGVKQDEIIDDLLAILAQILAEFEIFGDVITATLLEDLQSLLADLEVIGGDLLAQVVAILESYIDQLPQVVIDILTQLGLLPTIKVHVKLATQSLKKALSAKDIWTDLVDALMLQLVQILADLESWGITVSDDVLAQIENLILAVMAEGGQAWEVLQSLLEQYAFELQEVLGELLAQLGILPKTSVIKNIKATKDIFDDIFNALMSIIAELEQFGTIISQELIDTFTSLLLDLQGVSDEAFQLVVALLEQYAELLYEQFGDLLEQLGITVPPLVTPASSELMVAKDIIDDIFNVLDQILAEIDLIGSVVSDELIQTLTDLVLELEQVGGVAFEMILALLTQYAELLADQFGDLLAQLGITLPPTGTDAPAF